MEVTYKRSLHKSYMCVESIERSMESYELIMLKNCKIPQLLPIQTVVSDGSIKYLYEISGKQQLADYLSAGKVNKSNLEDMLFAIDRICKIMKDYLLNEDRLCLQLDFMYIDLTNKQIYFTYLPFWKKEFPQAFVQWTEEILKRIDHEDSEGTKLAYGVHELALRDNISINTIFSEILQTKEHKESVIPKVIEPKRAELYLKTEKQEMKEESKNERTLVSENFFSKYVKAEWLEKIKKIVSEKKEGYINSKQSIWKNKIKEKKSNTNMLSNAGQESRLYTASKENAEAEDKTCQYPTEYLGINSSKPSGRLLYQGRNSCSDFVIEQDEFLLGKKEGCVNGLIAGEGISRLHARIYCREEGYYIEDLNSTNGTFLNEQILEYHQEERLSKNDRIRFGGEEYVFY